MRAPCEIVGSEASITGSTNPQLVGVSGTVVEETRNMLRLETARGTRMFAKADSAWSIGGMAVAGAGLLGRPADRRGILR